jgi:hypothetical protein
VAKPEECCAPRLKKQHTQAKQKQAKTDQCSGSNDSLEEGKSIEGKTEANIHMQVKAQ